MRDDHIDLCGQIDFTRTEAKVDNLEKRMDAFERSFGELLRKNDVQTQLLTELKVKLDLMFEDKAKKKRGEKL